MKKPVSWSSLYKLKTKKAKGIDQILAESRNLYDAIRDFEATGLRGKALHLKVHDDERLLAASKRYYNFARARIWGYRLQGVWIANW